jgi:hypothetical protein
MVIRCLIALIQGGGGGNGCGLMVEGGWSCTGGGHSHGGSGAAVVQAMRWRGSNFLLGLRRTKVGGARRSGREGWRWAGGARSGEVGWVAWVGWQAKARGVGGLAWLEKKRKMKSIRN